MTDSIAILDFGSQYSQLIARRVREASVYSELFPWDAPAEKVLALQPRGFILSGGPNSVYEAGAPFLPDYVLESGLPVLGICYGMQALTRSLGGKVAPAAHREYGLASVEITRENLLLPPGSYPVWMSHGDRIETPPAGFVALAGSANSPIAAMGDPARRYYGVQFHPEVRHTPNGKEVLRRFVIDICGCATDWTPESIIQMSVERIRRQVGTARVLAGVSGGVDSSVAAALVHRAVGDQLAGVFVDTGMLRKNERAEVEIAFRQNLGVRLVTVNAIEDFMEKLQGVSEPEQKRKIIGDTFIRVFEAEAKNLGQPHFLVQGTIYPDVVESIGARPQQGGAHQEPSQCWRAAGRPFI